MLTCRLGIEHLEDRLTPNNRFVVPYTVTTDNATNFHTLAGALNTPGLVAGDVVQIEPFSTPGPLTDANVDAVNVPNVVIRGAAGFAPNELPPIRTGNAISLDAQEAGLSFSNVNLLLDHTLTFNASGSILNSTVAVGATGGYGIFLNSTATLLQGNTVLNTGITSGYVVISVNGPANSANLIDGNTLVNTIGTGYFVFFNSTAPVADVVSNNTFIGSDALESSQTHFISAGVNGLTIRKNTFRDSTAQYSAVFLTATTRNTQVLDNEFALNYRSATPAEAALSISGGAGFPVSATVRGNTFSTGPNGRAIDLRVLTGTVFDVKVERNTFLENNIGVYIVASAATAEVQDIDIGDGNLGGLGANNFRGFTAAATPTSGAVVVYTGGFDVSSRTVYARYNLWGVTSPETVLWDRNDSGTLADVAASFPTTGNAAFVQALYTRYLKRVGDVTSASDAGAWVNYLTGGGTQAAAANGIIHSQEALGYVVDDLYRTILGRDADAYGRSYHVNLLANGWTVEQVQAGLFGGDENKVRFPGDAAYVTNLFTTLLGRVPSTADLNAWLNVLPSLGRGGGGERVHQLDRVPQPGGEGHVL